MKFLLVDKTKRGAEPNPGQMRYAIQRLQEALDSKKIEHDFCTFSDIAISVRDGELIATVSGKPMSDYTHIIFRGHRNNGEYQLKRLAVEYARKHNIKVQNASFIAKMPNYNKLIQMALLTNAGLPYVDSYYCLDGRYDQKPDVLERIGFPLIYKHTEGEYREEIIDGKPKLKKNIYLINNVEELKREIEKRDDLEDDYIYKPSKYFIQKYVDIGQDFRAIMLGGKYTSGWKRVATGGFLTVNKGKYSLHDKPEPVFLKLAEQVNELFDADYCAIDIIYVGPKPYVLEINMNPGFKAFETKVDGCNIDIAEKIIEDMLK